MDVNMNEMRMDRISDGLTSIFSIYLPLSLYHLPLPSLEWNEEKCGAATVDVVVKLQLYHELPITHLSVCVCVFLPSVDDKKSTTFKLQQFSFLYLSIHRCLIHSCERFQTIYAFYELNRETAFQTTSTEE